MGALNTVEVQDFLKRNVNELFMLYLKEQSSALEIFMGNAGARSTDNTKYEWLEGQLTPSSFTVNATHATGTFDPTTPANLTLVSTTGLEAGSILRFTRGADAVPRGNLQLKIVAISSSTVATATIYGGSTDIALAANDVAVLVSKPRQENEKTFTEDKGWAPSTQYNFTQIFRENVDLSDTAIKSAIYGDFTTVSRQLEGVFYKIHKQMAEQCIFGLRTQRSATENGTFAGLDYYVNAAAGNVVDAASATSVTAAMINNVVEAIYKDGGKANTIITGAKRARQISALNVSGSNPVIAQNSTDAGSYVMRFISDLPIAGGLISNVILDPTIPSDRIYIVDKDKVALVPFTGRSIHAEDASLPGQDGTTALVRGEYTLEVADGALTHGVIKNLA